MDSLPTGELDPALVLMDFHDVVVKSHGDDGQRAVSAASRALRLARDRRMGIFHVVPHYRAGYPELTPGPLFDRVKAAGLFRETSIMTGIPEVLAPAPDEPIIAKFRYSPFYANDLLHMLRVRGARTLVLCGIATSGVVLSAVRDAWDLDYRVIVLADACADGDPEMHRLLINKLIPTQATVMAVADWCGPIALSGVKG